LSYIGNSPVYQAFITDSFSGNGSTVAFTMSVAPANAASVLVSVSGVLQDPSTYSVIGTVLTFSGAPPTGTGNISVRYLGVPASNITTTAYRTLTEFTATAGQTTFVTSSYVPGFLNVYQNGVMLGTADFTATNGTSVVLAVGATDGDLVTTEGFYVSSVVNAIQAIPGAVTSTYLAAGAAYQAFLDSASGTGNGALKLPVGTTAERPSGQPGLIRQNSTTGNPEWWDATTSTWLQFSQPAGYSVNYLVVAGGGGGGGYYYTGGGGAGGMLVGSSSLLSETAYTITVGAGGSGGNIAPSTNGANSSISTVATAIGGGGGGGYNGLSANGFSGGSGGGGSSGTMVGGSGTAGQGYAGGNGNASTGAGGGGAGAIGFAASGVDGGNGGAGAYSTISGASVAYAGGGGGSGGSASTTFGVGGVGGGGSSGRYSPGLAPTAGTANSGGGGGGGTNNSVAVSVPGGAGGSGIVIISYAGSQRGTGGTVTSSGGYTIHTFTSSGTYTA